MSDPWSIAPSCASSHVQLCAQNCDHLPPPPRHTFLKQPFLTDFKKHTHREYVGALGKVSHALVWPLELGLRSPTLQCGHLSGPSRARGGFFNFEVGGHDGAYKGRMHETVPFVGRKNGKLFDCQQSYNVLVLRVPGLEEGMMFVGKAL